MPGSEKAYICTQGPTKNTIQDFWKMIWEQNSNIIVMLTKEIENAKVSIVLPCTQKKFLTFPCSLNAADIGRRMGKQKYTED